MVEPLDMYSNFAGNPAALDGVALVAVPYTVGHVPQRSDTTASSLPPGAVADVDPVEGILGVWDDDLDQLKIDPPVVTGIDGSGAPDLNGWLFARASDGLLVAPVPYTSPVGGTAGMVLAPPGGVIAGTGPTGALTQRLGTVETTLSTTGKTTGQVLTVATPGAAPTWTTPIPGGGGGGLTVGILCRPVDMAGGDFTDVTPVSGGTIPRAYLVGVPVAVVAGPSAGLWTITASGPCTAGAPLTPGTVVTDFGGSEAVAGAEDGSTVTLLRITVTESAPVLRPALAGWPAILDTLKGRAQIATPPSKWLECGTGPGANRYWSTPTTLASPSDTMRVRVLTRSRSIGDPDGDNFLEFQEAYSESLDGSVGAFDRFEIAMATNAKGDASFFWEMAEVGSSAETSAEDNGLDPYYSNGMGSPLPSADWVLLELLADFPGGTLTWRVRVDSGWDHLDPDDGTTWRTTRVLDKGSPYTLEDSDGIEQWIGRGDGEFDVARVQRWDDGVLVLDANAETGTVGASTLVDSVLGDTWTAQGDNVIVAAPSPGGGAVDSVNGQTGVVVLDADDIPDGTTNHAFTAADDTKLAGIATGATANSSDATLLARANHTGTQAQSTVVDLTTDLAARALLAWNPAPKKKPANEDRTSTTTLSSDADLTFAVSASEVWDIDMGLVLSSGGAAVDMVLGLDLPTGATCAVAVLGPLNNVTLTQPTVTHLGTLLTSATTVQVGAVDYATLGATYVELRGTVTIGANAGTVALKWAQRISSATPMTVLAGSVMRRRRIA